MFWQVFGHPERLSPDEARGHARAMADGPGFRATLAATRRRRFVRHGDIEGPVTLAFGTRDRILLRRQARFTDELPAHTWSVDIAGAGHVPMSDAPADVARLILRSTAAERAESG
jgi:pimeloyl-ACP methyl ester carboxylesterase